MMQNTLDAENGAKASSAAEKLLAMVTTTEPQVRVILDVGAQILELDNFHVAVRWLEKLPDDART
jgi:hypothetical protein